MSHEEHHKSHRVGWLRAAVLGANDGIVSTASLIIGVAAAQALHSDILLAGLAGLVAGAMSMAAGEYVSVCSQADTEKADLKIELESINKNREFEQRELAEIYVARGLTQDLAKQVAQQLMAHDALDAHAREELGIYDRTKARPFQAATYSAITFTVGAGLPLITTWLAPREWVIPAVAILSLVFLSVLGATAAFAGGAPLRAGALRVTFWGAFAMLATALVGHIFGVSIQ